MSPEEFRAAAHQTVDWIADYLRDIRQYPVTPRVQPGDLTARLPARGPEHGEPIENILEDFRALIVPGLTHWNHPRFFGYFSVSASGPGILGEMLAAALNVNHMLWKTGPSATELEQVALSWLRQWIGLPDEFFGIIHDTASTGSLHAVIAAREAARESAGGGQPELVLYTSEHANLSVDRAALGAGIGRGNIRHIAIDDDFRMSPAELAAAVEADLAAGKKPFCVVPTLGTTSSTSLDPLPEIAAIAKRYGLWLHVDAAYAGPAAILDEYRHILAGAELADSLVLNPHKWLFTPVDLSALYTRRPEAFRRALSLNQAPAYIQTGDNPNAINLSDYSVALGRRFRSLKLWFVLRYYGREGIAEILRGHMRMAREFGERVVADPRFELTAPILFSLVCFRLRGSDDENRALLERINSSGDALLSGTTLRGKFVLRLAIGNIATTDADLDATWTLVSAAVLSSGAPQHRPPGDAPESQ
jgi:aromatic-L-amino-acid/L-tryptophan decarboxylase